MNGGEFIIGAQRRQLDDNVGNGRVAGSEARSQLSQIRQAPGIELSVDRNRELGFAGALMRQSKQFNHDLARRPIVASLT